MGRRPIVWLVGLVGLALSASASPADGQPLRASVVSVDLAPSIGVPLAGYSGRRLKFGQLFKNRKYATYFEPSTDVLDPIRANVLYLEAGGKQLLFVAVDLIGADRRMRSDLVKRLSALGFDDTNVVLAASHTHSGPGTFAKNWVWELAAADTYMRSVYRDLVDRIVQAVTDAHGVLEPASLWSYSFVAVDLQKNRAGQPGHFDAAANVLLVKNAAGAWLGGLVNLPIHGTSLEEDNLLFSADVTGRMQREFELRLLAANPDPAGRRPTVLYLNGAEGDVKPAAQDEAGMQTIGTAFANQAMAAIGSAAPVTPDWSIARTKVGLGRARFNLRACLDVPFFVRWLVGIPNLAISTAFPRSTSIWAIRLGDHLMLTWPGEPNTTLGLELKALGTSHGAAQTWVLGLTNDHLSYFVDPPTYAGKTYEACSSLYGASGGVKMVNGFRAIVAGLFP